MPIISASAGQDTLILGIKLSGQIKSNLYFDFLFIDVHLTYYYLIQWSYPPLNNLLQKIISWGHFPIAIFLQYCNYQFAMSEANKSSHDWCEPKLWSIVSRRLIEKHFKLKTNKRQNKYCHDVKPTSFIYENWGIRKLLIVCFWVNFTADFYLNSEVVFLV